MDLLFGDHMIGREDDLCLVVITLTLNQMFSYKWHQLLRFLTAENWPHRLGCKQPGCQLLRLSLDVDRDTDPVHHLHVVEEAGSTATCGYQHIFEISHLQECQPLNPAELLLSFFCKQLGDCFVVF